VPPERYYSFRRHVEEVGLEEVVFGESLSSTREALGVKAHLMEGVAVRKDEGMGPWAQAEYRVEERALCLKRGGGVGLR